MKKSPSLSTPCETAAVRVQCWFGKDKGNLLPTAQPTSKSQDFSKKHKCDLVKTPRIPSQVEHLPLQGYLSKKKRHNRQRHVTKENFLKTLPLSVDQSYCTISQKNFNHLQSEYALSSARVAYCRLKEHLLVSKRLKSITKQGDASPKRHEVVPIKSSNQQDLPKNPYLEEWEKIKEERHFQIGRVIKYLTD
jgi:hypothetical protein